MKYSILLLALLASTAQATDRGWTPLTGSSHSNSEATAIAGAKASAASGSVSVGEGGDGGNGGNTAINIQNKNRRNAPAIFAGNIPTTIHSCRLYMFGGGSSPNGAVTGSIPLGNDQTCLAVVKVNLMEKVGGFTRDEVVHEVCKIEGMSDLQTCKDLQKH